jgi:hypothetical protein
MALANPIREVCGEMNYDNASENERTRIENFLPVFMCRALLWIGARVQGIELLSPS